MITSPSEFWQKRVVTVTHTVFLAIFCQSLGETSRFLVKTLRRTTPPDKIRYKKDANPAEKNNPRQIEELLSHSRTGVITLPQAAASRQIIFQQDPLPPS